MHVFHNLLLLPAPAAAFTTLDGDRSAWQRDPTWELTNSSRAIRDGSDADAIADAFERWEDVRNADVSFSEVARNADITIAFLADWPPDVGETTAGFTLTQRGGGRITSAEICLNDRDFTWTTDGRDEGELADVDGVATHEIGHAIGFGHSWARDATMYWSGTTTELRTLHDDDRRGLRFLYGDYGAEGQLCDTCLANDECDDDGICLSLDDGGAYCGQPCDRSGRCPDGFSCWELRDGGTQCAPAHIFCSDMGNGEDYLEYGDYCWGQGQCRPPEMCVPIPGGRALCTRECDSDRDCGGSGRCIGAEDGQEGICLVGGDGEIGDACEAGTDCESLLCLPLSEDDSVCSEECDPLGDCGRGYGCTPWSWEDWFCLPEGDREPGDPCQLTCDGGLMCLPEDDEGNGTCVLPCDDRDEDSCPGGAACFDVDGRDGNLGICPTGDGALGDPCESSLDCTDFLCVADLDDGGMCSRQCTRSNPCPEGFRCSALQGLNFACFRDPDAPAEGEGEGPAEGEGEGEPPAEGEGEGEPPAEGEGEGEPPAEGEGEPPAEGEGEQPAEGEGEGQPPGGGGDVSGGGGGGSSRRKSGCATAGGAAAGPWAVLVLLGVLLPRRRRTIAVLLALLALPATAIATTTKPLSLDELVRRADVIARGVVETRNAAWDEAGRFIHTWTTLRVTAVWKGSAVVGQELRLRQLGGTVGGISQTLPGNARLSVGEDVIVFVRRDPARDLHYLVGLAQGKVSVGGGAEPTVGRDLAGLAFPDADGRAEPAVPPGGQPLTAFTRALRSLTAALLHRADRR